MVQRLHAALVAVLVLARLSPRSVPRRVQKQCGHIKGELCRTSENTDRKLNHIRRALAPVPKSS